MNKHKSTLIMIAVFLMCAAVGYGCGSSGRSTVPNIGIPKAEISCSDSACIE